MWSDNKVSMKRHANHMEWRMLECFWEHQELCFKSTSVSATTCRLSFAILFILLWQRIWVCVRKTWWDWKKEKSYILCEKEVHIIWGSLHSIRKNLLCFYYSCSEIETLFFSLYSTLHFKSAPAEVNFRKQFP